MRLMNKVSLMSGIVGILALSGAAAYAAGFGYSPGTTTVPSGTPGGFTQVVTATTVSPTSTTTSNISVTVDNVPITIAVAPGTFSVPVQVVITAPILSQVTSSLSALGLGGYSTIAGLGVNVVNVSGQPLAGTFLKPVHVTVHNSAIKPGDKVVEWNAHGTFSTVTSATFSNGIASWSFQQDPAFAIVAPSSLVPGATSPVTGKPFRADAVTGLALVALGGSVLWWTRRRNAS
ncbi:MAG: hypothetical protein OWR62_14900 [Sulfobacillus thermotolerans]|nr:hypothetical protein [Sulfobacillus thermotolerans]